MLDQEIKRLIQQALQSEGLWDSVNQEKSQFLQVEYPYTHLVLDDASKYEQTLETMRILKLNASKDLEYVVRSVWEIVAVDYRGPYYDAAGNLYMSSDVGVTLRSQSRVHQLRVAVSDTASRALQEISGAAENDYERHKQDMVDTVRQYIEILLSGEGRDNSWDPLWQQSDLQINADGINWIRSQVARR
ncbi:MAG: hypothetical protein WCE73_02135 [Candidatus Angelobacter sp.]